MTDPEHWPHGHRHIPSEALRRLDEEISRYLRMQRIIDDIKRRCGVTNQEKT